MKAPTFDSQGDISEQTEAEITSFLGNRADWLRFCARCWNKDYGFVYRDGPNICFVTRGWSGNELIIGAMEQNHAMWSICWESSHRGGLHVFQMEAQ